VLDPEPGVALRSRFLRTRGRSAGVKRARIRESGAESTPSIAATLKWTVRPDQAMWRSFEAIEPVIFSLQIAVDKVASAEGR
jgi:hypothetical protein